MKPSFTAVDIVGLVNDIVTGTVNAADCTVVVDGQAGNQRVTATGFAGKARFVA